MMMLDLERMARILKREAAAAAAYYESFPEKAPGKPGKGKTAAWRKFRRMVKDHETTCLLNLRFLGIRRVMGDF